MRARKYFIFVLSLIITFVGIFVSAQVRNTDIVLNISPQYPGPNQNITATLNSHTLNLDKAKISWSVNDQEVISGIGKKTLSFKTEAVGAVSTVLAVIDTVDGQSLTKTITITPASVDMLWEAYDSYTPPFYKGKALAPSQGTFKVVAIPGVINQSGKINSNNLSYTWTKDNKVQQNSSGWGKNSFLFINSYLDKGNTIKVKVSDISGGNNASGQIDLNTKNPKIVFYKNDSLGTNWNNALSDGFTINSTGETIVVEPYFFSPKNISSSDLAFDWFLNGEKIETPNPKNVLSIKPEVDKSGNATIEISISNINTLFQSLERKLNVTF